MKTCGTSSVGDDFEPVLAALADGTMVRLRRLHAEDEPLLYELAARMGPEDLRLRFFIPLKELSHDAAARLAHFDDAGKLGLLALSTESGNALGVARFAADPTNQDAEFAISVRSDRKRRGLGRLLLGRLIAEARRRGLKALFGDVLRENEAMVALCRSLGFALARHPDDPRILRLTLAL